MSEVSIVNIRPEFATALTTLQHECFPTLGEQELMSEKHFLKHCEIFPEGEFVALVDGVRFLPPLNITNEQIAEGMAILEEAIASV